MARAFRVSDHAVERYVERVSATVTRARVPGVLKNAWRKHKVTVLGERRGRELCRVGDLLIVIRRTNTRIVVITVLGRLPVAQIAAAATEGGQVVEAADIVAAALDEECSKAAIGTDLPPELIRRYTEEDEEVGLPVNST